MFPITFDIIFYLFAQIYTALHASLATAPTSSHSSQKPATDTPAIRAFCMWNSVFPR